jgi:hypothetical protein
VRKLFLVVIVVFLTTGAAMPACKNIHNYDRVVLYGSSEDPDVLLWDSRERMRDYEDGTFVQMNLLLPHARLLPPGTRAVVQLCIADYVQPPYLKSATDAIGVVISTGPLRGSYGWVVGSDIRAIYPGPIKHGPGPL